MSSCLVQEQRIVLHVFKLIVPTLWMEPKPYLHIPSQHLTTEHTPRLPLCFQNIVSFPH